MKEEAGRILQRAGDSNLLQKVPGLYDGDAGWGLANLHFWLATQDEMYLDRAEKAAWRLTMSARHDAQGAYWEVEGAVPLGMGAGGSGIALFLLYLNAIKPNRAFLDIATSAIDLEIANATWTGNKVNLQDRRTTVPLHKHSPHMEHGSGGLATAALRLYAATGEERHRKFVEQCCYTVSSRLTNKLWQDWGLAGYGELLIDAFSFLGDENYLNTAYYIAEGILPYRISDPCGIAFPGEELLRISTDFGLGSAGIGMFFNRLTNPSVKRFLLLDEVLPVPSAKPDRYLVTQDASR